MLNENRLASLNYILSKLRGLNGIAQVESDDYNSVSVNVFLTLAGDKHNLSVPLRKTKNAIKRECRPAACRILSQPTPQYEYAGMGEKLFRKGYDSLIMKIEIFV